MRDLKRIINENEAALQTWQARWLQLEREIRDKLAYTQELKTAAGLQQALTMMEDIMKGKR